MLAYPGVRPEFDRAVLPEYLAFGYLSGPKTFYSGIRKLMPGHTLEMDEQRRKCTSGQLLGPCAGKLRRQIRRRELLHRKLSGPARRSGQQPSDE